MVYIITAEGFAYLRNSPELGVNRQESNRIIRFIFCSRDSEGIFRNFNIVAWRCRPSIRQKFGFENGWKRRVFQWFHRLSSDTQPTLHSQAGRIFSKQPIDLSSGMFPSTLLVVRSICRTISNERSWVEVILLQRTGIKG